MASPDPIIDAIKTAYDIYRAAKVLTQAQRQAIIDLGPIPQFGDIIATDPEYDDIVAARAAWNISIATLRTNLDTAKNNEVTAYIAVINAGLWLNQWVELTGLAVSPTTAYIGVADTAILQKILTGYTVDIPITSLPTIVELTDEPANNFPDQTPL